MVRDLPPALQSEDALRQHFVHGPPSAVAYSADDHSARLEYATRALAEQARAKHRFYKGTPLSIEWAEPASTH